HLPVVFARTSHKSASAVDFLCRSEDSAGSARGVWDLAGARLVPQQACEFASVPLNQHPAPWPQVPLRQGVSETSESRRRDRELSQGPAAWSVRPALPGNHPTVHLPAHSAAPAALPGPVPAQFPPLQADQVSPPTAVVEVPSGAGA